MDHNMTDEEIALQVQKGDTESFGLLVGRYEAKLTRYGRKFLSNGQDIEDLVQDIFVKTYTNIQSFDTRMRFSPWIYRIAHNEYVNAIKKKSRLQMFTFDLDAVFPQLFAKETADQDVNEKDIKNMLDRCLVKLNPKYREPLVLYYIEEMSYQEIADILHLPISTVGVRLNRGKEFLKKIFIDKFPKYETR